MAKKKKTSSSDSSALLKTFVLPELGITVQAENALDAADKAKEKE